MALQIEKATREFKYNGTALQDPDPKMSPDQVREFYATLYPDINNAAIEGPTQTGAKMVYEFRRAVGTKGGSSLREHLDALIAGTAPQVRNAPPADCFEISTAIRECVEQTLSAVHRHGPQDFLAADSSLLPPLP